MRPYYGSLNDKNQWWDGKNWVTQKKPDALKQLTQVKESFLDGCHMDGVFECPRCWRPHFLPDNYDLLCDGCANVCIDLGGELKDKIMDFKEKARNYWTAGGYKDPEITARMEIRNNTLFNKFAESMKNGK
jgi:hypothetical protein